MSTARRWTRRTLTWVTTLLIVVPNVLVRFFRDRLPQGSAPFGPHSIRWTSNAAVWSKAVDRVAQWVPAGLGNRASVRCEGMILAIKEIHTNFRSHQSSERYLS